MTDSSESPATAAATPEATAPAAFDMKNHPGLRVLSWLVLALLVYALLDTFFVNPYAYIGAPPLAIFGSVAAVVLVGAFLIGRGGPGLERAAVAGIVAVMAGLASYPATLRINQWTDSEAPRMTDYLYLGEGRFGPTVAGAPQLDFSEHVDLWPFSQGHVHAFDLAYGSMGFYQLNVQRVRRELGNSRIGLTTTSAE